MSVLTQKVRLLDVVYDATSNELVLTKPLTMNIRPLKMKLELE